MGHHPGAAAEVHRADPRQPLRVLMVAENMSVRLSGETLVPYYYFQGFLESGLDAWAICHARVRDHLRDDLDPAHFARITFVEDRLIQRLLFAFGRRFPPRIADLVFNQLISITTQWSMRDAVRALIDRHAIQAIFQPIPIAPKAPSFLYGLGIPVVIGPMSGAMDLPPAFRDMEGSLVRLTIRASRTLAGALHRLIPGKRRAAALIVANPQTRAALPRPIEGRIIDLTESGVDLARWPPRLYPASARPAPVRFIFCSRFVDWKGIRFLVDAFVPLAREGGCELHLVGDGELFGAIRRQIDDAGIDDSVFLHGRVPLAKYAALLRESDVYVTPSLRECGGMAMLEAMAVGLPVIGVNWGGAAQYTTPACALLIDPSSKHALVEGLTHAMRDLARSYPRRRALGMAARRHLIENDMSWQAKADAVAAILRDMTSASASAVPGSIREGASTGATGTPVSSAAQ